MKRGSSYNTIGGGGGGGGGAGSNWKALKKTLNSDASTSSSSTTNTTSSPSGRRKASTTSHPKSRRTATTVTAANESEGSRASSPAPTSLPWFAEDISPQDLELVRQSASDKISRSGEWEGIMDAKLKKKVILGGLPSDANPTKKEPGNYLAIDCEMVGVGEKGCESILARVSIVNFHGALIMDRFVRPQEKVTDYRTWVSGVRPKDLKNAPSFHEVQGEVANLIKGKVLVGHAIQNDLKALLLSHPKPLVRDTSTFQPLRDLAKTKYPSLKKLAKLVLGIDIQMEGEAHSSVEDARATMAIFRSQKSKWDEVLRGKGGHHGGGGGGARAMGNSNNKVWKPPANGESVNAASPALSTRRNLSSSSTTAAGNALQETVRLKPRMAAKADWWKDSM
ncbi:related to REX4 - strong similarity to X.laevis XPMC2 protein [Ustilago trichophora]|uniref:RNA exonuclease 4 n=1 Tax=Ustilago trichophora TaxID=86804 RepID=A0A5C3DVI5_9BASI|nr:related to REX4 - strong similarity to X.laevis XPMC2 protein [Ustilago trichophora]